MSSGDVITNGAITTHIQAVNQGVITTDVVNGGVYCNFNASYYDNTYGRSTQVRPKSVNSKMFIKF